MPVAPARWVCPECGTLLGMPAICPRDGTQLIEASGDALLGEMLGSYRVTRLIGQGGMGRVYRGVHPAIGSRVAIKVLSQAEPALIERFFAEARTVNLIRHEHIVNVLDFAMLAAGHPYIVMEYLDGTTLTALIASRRALPLGWLSRLAGEVLSALEAAHAAGVVHRDLKPDNIFVSPGGHAKVLDFGIAKLRSNVPVVTPETRAGALVGTPYYMSPEQAAGQRVDTRSDLYSLGVVLYECVAGRRPFDSDNLYQLLRMHVEVAPEPPSRFRPDVPPALEQCILRALQKDPGWRPQSAAEMKSLIEASVAHLGAQSFAPPTWVSGAAGERHPISAPPTPQIMGTMNAPAPVTAHALAHTTEPASRSRGGWVWAVLGTVVLLGLGAMASIVIIVFIMLRTPEPSRRVVRPASSGPTARTDLKGSPIDASAEIGRAEKLAREKLADAELVRIDITGMDSTGRVDLNRTGLDSGPSVDFGFVSPSRAPINAKEPENAKKTRCMARVTFEQDGIQVYDDTDFCDQKKVPRPRCTTKQIFQRATERGGTGKIGEFSYRASDDDGTPEWYVSMTGFEGWIADAC